MVFIKIIFTLFISSIALMVFIGYFTAYIDKKPKSNKLRQWWSNNICDLDNKFN
jgi:hypothetical protein